MRMFLPYLVCFCCSVCVLAPVLCGIIVWLTAEAIVERNIQCDVPLVLWCQVAAGSIVAYTFMLLHPVRKVIACFCAWDFERAGLSTPPRRFSLVFDIVPSFIFAWDIVGLYWVTVSGSISSDKPACRTEAAGLHSAVSVYASFSIFLLLFVWLYSIGLRRVLLAMMRAGIISSSMAAPKETLQLSTRPVEADDELLGDESACSICLVEYSSELPIVQTKVCRHSFHRQCLEHWLTLNRNCPLCRFDLVAENVPTA